MAKLLKLRRGTTSQHSSFTGAEGEVTVDTDKESLVVHNGSQAGGFPLLRQDLSNLPAGTIDNSDVNSSAAIAGTKISPNFGSQNIVTAGSITCGGEGTVEDVFRITDSAGGQRLLMGNQDSAGVNCPKILSSGNGSLTIGIGYSWSGDGGTLTNQFTVGKNGVITSHYNHDFSAGIDVTGTSSFSGSFSITGDITSSSSNSITGFDAITLVANTPVLNFTESDGDPDYRISVSGGVWRVEDVTNGYATRLAVNTDGHVDVIGNLDVGAGIDVTGASTFSGDATFSGGAGAATIGAGSDIRFTNGNWSGEHVGKIQYHSNKFYLQSTSGWQFRDANGAATMELANDGTITGGNLGFNSDITFNGGFGGCVIGSSTDLRFNAGNWSGEQNCKIQNNGNILYIQGGTHNDYDIAFRKGGTGQDQWYIMSSGEFRPATTTNDIGNASNRVRNIYTNDLHLSNKDSSNDVDGTWGDWTIQEGESDLFLKNNRSGKKFKFNLTEVS